MRKQSFSFTDLTKMVPHVGGLWGATVVPAADVTQGHVTMFARCTSDALIGFERFFHNCRVYRLNFTTVRNWGYRS